MFKGSDRKQQLFPGPWRSPAWPPACHPGLPSQSAGCPFLGWQSVHAVPPFGDCWFLTARGSGLSQLHNHPEAAGARSGRGQLVSDSSLSPQLLAVNTEHAQFMSKGMHARMHE